MRIFLSPVRCDTPLQLDRRGDVLTLNGDTLDLSVIPEGASLPAQAVASDWVVGPVQRKNGTLSLTLRLPHGADAPRETLFPAPLWLDRDGLVALPAHDTAPSIPPIEEF